MEVLPGVHRVPGVRGPNAYLLEDDDGLTLVDTGWPGGASTILSYIRALGHHPEELSRILITHGHPDHTGNARRLREATGAQVLIHPGDAQTDAQGGVWVRHVGMLFMPLPSEWRIRVDGLVGEGDVLPVLGGLRVLHTPGHTPGSVCFYLERLSALFTGDLVTQRGPFISQGVALPGSNLGDHRRSFERVVEMTFDTACLAHGDVLNGGASETLRRAAQWYQESPRWMRVLQSLPRPLRLGLETGYRFR